MPLRAGHLVYRVIEVDPPDENQQHSWKVVSLVVANASDKQIKLKGFFSDMFKRQFAPDALGRHFFETPHQAIEHFLAARREEIASLDRRRVTAERAIAWAFLQKGITT